MLSFFKIFILATTISNCAYQNDRIQTDNNMASFYGTWRYSYEVQNNSHWCQYVLTPDFLISEDSEGTKMHCPVVSVKLSENIFTVTMMGNYEIKFLVGNNGTYLTDIDGGTTYIKQ